MENLRRHSHSSASSCRQILTQPKNSVCRILHQRASQRLDRVKVNAYQKEAEEGPYIPPALENPQIWNRDGFMWDNSYQINNKFNQEPDFNDPEWHDKVTDWGEFWNYQKWDLEVEGLDDEHDVGGNPVNSDFRIQQLFAAIKDMKSRGDVMNMLGPTNYHENLSVWENPPCTPDLIPKNPEYSYSDLRAIAEKRRRKEIMDREWKRRQALVGRFQYPHHDAYKIDERLAQFEDIQDIDWSYEQTYQLITMNGIAAKPESHQGFVENPLIPVDYVTTCGVSHIEETEDFIESLGRLASPEEEINFNEEVMLDAMDLMNQDAGDLAEEISSSELGARGMGNLDDSDSDCDGDMDDDGQMIVYEDDEEDAGEEEEEP